MPKRSHGSHSPAPLNAFSRRDFLKIAGALAAGSLLAGCGVESLDPTPTGTNIPLQPWSLPQLARMSPLQLL